MNGRTALNQYKANVCCLLGGENIIENARKIKVYTQCQINVGLLQTVGQHRFDLGLHFVFSVSELHSIDKT